MSPKKLNLDSIDFDNQTTANVMLQNNERIKRTGRAAETQLKIKSSKRTERLNVSVTEDIYNRMLSQTRQQGVTLTDLVNQMLDYCLNLLEQ